MTPRRLEKPIVALDNEYVSIQITGKMDVDPNNRGDLQTAI